MNQPQYSEDPREWRKMVLLNLLGFTLLSLVLRWRGVCSTRILSGLLACLGTLAIIVTLRPTAFRGWYRALTTFGHGFSQLLGQVVLVLFFIFVLTPLGLVLRLFGNDLLRLKRNPKVSTYWRDGRDSSPLDRIF